MIPDLLRSGNDRKTTSLPSIGKQAFVVGIADDRFAVQKRAPGFVVYPRDSASDDWENYRCDQLFGSEDSLGESPSSSPSVFTPSPRTVRLA